MYEEFKEEGPISKWSKIVWKKVFLSRQQKNLHKIAQCQTEPSHWLLDCNNIKVYQIINTNNLTKCPKKLSLAPTKWFQMGPRGYKWSHIELNGQIVLKCSK